MFLRVIYSFFYITGITRIIAWLNRRYVMILCYHSVTEQIHSTASDPWKLQMNVGLFTSHLKFLQKYYRVVSLQEFLDARREGRRLPPFTIVLTFDDGQRNFLTLAAPLLARYSHPATVFIITDYTDEMSEIRQTATPIRRWTAEDDKLYLSWQEIELLREEYSVEFGSHTCSHPRLFNIALPEAKTELQNSFAAVAVNTRETSIAFSYPHGQASPKLAKLAESAQYSCALTTMLGGNLLNTNPYLLRRIIIDSDDDLATFAARLSGLTWWFETAKTFLRPFVKKSSKRDAASGANSVRRVNACSCQNALCECVQTTT